MRRFVLALFLASSAALLWPAASLAVAPRVVKPPALPAAAWHGMRYPTRTGMPVAAVPHASGPLRALHSPEARVFAQGVGGPCMVTGTALDYYGMPIVGADVEVWYSDDVGDSYYVGSTTTDTTGSFQYIGAPQTPNGEIDVYPASDNDLYMWGLSFTAGGPNSFTLRPGQTGAIVVRSSGFSWEWFRVDTVGTGGGATTWIDGDSGTAMVMPPDYDYAVAYPYPSQGIEWHAGSSLPATAGATDGLAMSFNEADGRDAWIAWPYWQSGGPGTPLVVGLENWPSGYEAAFYGISDPSFRENDWSGYVTCDGYVDDYVGGLSIPRSATPGYDYELHVWRYDDETSWLDLTTDFQVASLKASRSSIARGASIRLSGVVPTQGHNRSHRGRTKVVTIYQRTKAAGPPTAWNAAAKGWHKVCTVRANGLGKYTSRLLRPQSTTWYIVRYPGDDWYYRGYTSVIKVRVK